MSSVDIYTWSVWVPCLGGMRNRKIVWLTERRKNSRLHLQLIKDMARIHINGGKFFTNILAPHVSLITVFVTDSGFIRKTIHKQRALKRVETKFGRVCAMISGLWIKTMEWGLLMQVCCVSHWLRQPGQTTTQVSPGGCWYTGGNPQEDADTLLLVRWHLWTVFAGNLGSLLLWQFFLSTAFSKRVWNENRWPKELTLHPIFLFYPLKCYLDKAGI